MHMPRAGEDHGLRTRIDLFVHETLSAKIFAAIPSAGVAGFG